MGQAALGMPLLILLLLGILTVPNNSQAKGFGQERKLSEYVHHYEPLTYDASGVHTQHHRHKRSLPEEDHKVNIQFESHGRSFDLELKRDHSVFHDGLVLERGYQGSQAHDFDVSHIYEGGLWNEPESHCFGAIRDGVFDGQIHTASEGIYYIERANKYFDTPDLQHEDNNNTSKFHSVIYHEKHLIDPFHHSKKVNLGLNHPGCGISDSTQSWMDQIQHSGEKDDSKGDEQEQKDSNKNDKTDEEDIVDEPIQFETEDPLKVGPAFKYSAEGNTPRRKRSTTANPNMKKSCSLYIQTDPLFWLHIKKHEKNDQKIEEEILSLIAQHVKAVNRIYSDTAFEGKKLTHTGYQFQVQRITIHNDTNCKGLANRVAQNQPSYLTSLELSSLDESNPFCTPNVDVSNFLNLHSKSNHEDICLAYVFTYRDFTGGTLGLAWVASASGASGGICETYKRYTENINGVHHTAKRSLNTGIITFVNYNSPVPPKVSQLTLAHEIGHNFGSPHDYPSECRPGGKVGNYIMFASATSGDRDNNNKFSHCSKSNISAVLDAIVDNRKKNCFQKSDGAFCGNKIVEVGEECDCGFDDAECQETCCYPRQGPTTLSPEEQAAWATEKRCKRKPFAECSPSEGPCCESDCKFTDRSKKTKCKHMDDCTEDAFCNGRNATCPNPDPKPDNVTECNQGTQVCQQGECKDSICVKFGLVSCFLTSDTVSNKRQLCELACQNPGKNNTCMSTAELAKSGRLNISSEGLSLRPGSPCDNFQGYCDVFLKCRKVDAEGPLVRLKNLLFNPETLLTIVQLVTEYWWAVLLMGIAFVIFMAICIKCFSIHTPSSNPRLAKRVHLAETLRRPVRALRQKHYRPANNGSSSGSGAPPPYPGRGGPGHGYGNGRGHYNRASNHPAEFNQLQGRPTGSGHPDVQRDHRDQRDQRRSGSSNRHSRMEMQPIR
jgi:disintegrin and metalloproteinase domain-containing protein 10